MPSQSDLCFTFAALASKTPFEVVSFTLKEAISAPFALHLELVSHECDVDFNHLLDHPSIQQDIKHAVADEYRLASRFSAYDDHTWSEIVATLPQARSYS